jgi:hypothetical protein
MTRPRLRVALPWLEDAARDAHARQALPGLPGLAWLMARGEASALAQSTWRHWLLETGGQAADSLLRRWPAGPCLAAMAGLGAEGVGTWACAQPAHLAAAMDHLRLAAMPQAGLSASDQANLLGSINAQLADRGFALVPSLDEPWLLRCPGSIDCVAHEPAAATGQNIHDFMPSGRDGARVRSLMNEIQMVLHEHPVNEQRARRQQPPINSVWLWGFGAPFALRSLAAPAAESGVAGAAAVGGVAAVTGAAAAAGADAAVRFVPTTPLRTDDPWLRTLWRLHGGEATPWAPLQSMDLVRDVFIAVAQPPAADAAAALDTIDATLLEPLRAALAAGHLAGIHLLIGSRVVQLEASARYKIWRREGIARLLS